MTKLLCSFAQCEITPDLEKETVIQDGYGSRFTPAEEVRDPLYAKIACFKQEENTFAIVSMDICGMSEKRKNTLRAWIGGISGLKDEAFALCGTHTHAGPACGVLGYLPENEFYWDRVGKTVGFALKEALSHWEEATLSFGYCTPLNAMENLGVKVERLKSCVQSIEMDVHLALDVHLYIEVLTKFLERNSLV